MSKNHLDTNSTPQSCNFILLFVMTKKPSLAFLEQYLNTPSPTGFEFTGQKVWLEYITKYVDHTFVDTYGTAVGVINPESEYKVIIEAHADEISRFVNYIDER